MPTLTRTRPLSEGERDLLAELRRDALAFGIEADDTTDPEDLAGALLESWEAMCEAAALRALESGEARKVAPADTFADLL